MNALRIVLLPIALAAALPAHAGGMSPELLLASAWCTFSYNKTTGYSSTKRVYFNANGSWGMGSRGEGYSSGPNGSIASQRDAKSGGLWKVDRGELFMSEGAAPVQPVQTLLKRNSNGYPIIVANGIEYSQCR
jgi:hypothetical protein